MITTRSNTSQWSEPLSLQIIRIHQNCVFVSVYSLQKDKIHFIRIASRLLGRIDWQVKDVITSIETFFGNIKEQ